MDKILEKLQKLASLKLEEAAELATAIRAEYNEMKATESVDLDVAQQLASALEATNTRIGELKAEEAKALEELSALDAVFAVDGDVDADAEGDDAEGDDADAAADAEGDAPEGDDADAEGDAEDDEAEGDTEGDADADAEGDAADSAELSSTPRVISIPALSQKNTVKTPKTSSKTTEGLSFKDADGRDRSEKDLATAFRKAFNHIPKHLPRGATQTEFRAPVATFSLDETVVPKVGRFQNFAEAGEVFAELSAKRNERLDEDSVLKASGGACVARRQEFGLGVIGGDSQPVQDAAVVVQSDGKGTSFYKSLEAFSHLSGSAAVYTEAQDISGAAYPKACASLACPTPVNCDKEFIESCVSIGNWVDMAWPEYVAAVKEIANDVLARTAEINRLKKIYAEAVANANLFNETAQPTGASNQILDVILRYVTADRRASRVGREVRYTALVQQGLEEQLVIDLARKMNTTGEQMTPDQAVFEILRKYNISISFYNAKDTFGTPAGVAGLAAIPVIGAGAVLPKWDAKTRIAIMREDTMYIDKGGELDLGVFRTQSDFETNNYHIFMEFQEAVCFRNNHLFVIDTLACPNGLQVGTTTAPVCA